MSDFIRKVNDGIFIVFLIGVGKCFLVLIAIIGVTRSCIGCDEVDIDNSYMVRRYDYDRIFIEDSIGNGFELLYYTTEAVTDKRFEEIKSRRHLDESYKKFKNEAADHFNHDLQNTNIYDFVKYAKTFDLDSTEVRLVNIWVYGKFKILYRRPHDLYPDGWKSGDDYDLGLLFLKEYDVYPYNFEAPQCYRYWGCDATSLSDERYSHVTEADRRRSKN